MKRIPSPVCSRPSRRFINHFASRFLVAANKNLTVFIGVLQFKIISLQLYNKKSVHITFQERKMKRTILMAVAILAMASGVQAKNSVYGVGSGGIVNDGYKLFVSDKILDTISRAGYGDDHDAGYCNAEERNTTKNLGDISTIRSDNRFSIPAAAKISYPAACLTFGSVIKRLKTADDVRKLWLLFADSATDEFAAETLKKDASDEELRLYIELKRLDIVSKYIEFFTKNKDWKLTDYTFLAQALKSRKGKVLSPAFCRFIEALVTGDDEKAFQVVKSIDMENLGSRFIVPGTHATTR
jgi:predicted small secreted protein